MQLNSYTQNETSGLVTEKTERDKKVPLELPAKKNKIAL
jgi:hypothetical protein